MSAEAPLQLIERQDWLEPLETAAQRAVADAFGRAGEKGLKAQSILHGDWLGHPLHPSLTDIPVGAWTASMVLDLMDAAGRSECRAGADVTLEVGLVGAVLAALAGVTDWHTMDGSARRVGFVHGMLNLAAAGLYTSSLIARKRRNRGLGRCLACGGFAVAMASAWLGGSLVFPHSGGEEQQA